MKISWQVHKIQLKRPFTISKGTFHYRNALIIILEKEGIQGYGECTEISYYGISIDAFIETLKASKSQIESLAFDHPTIFYQHIQKIVGNIPFLLSAIDGAYHDLFGKMVGEKTRTILGVQAEDETPISSLTIGIDSLPEMQRQILDTPWSSYKIKLGSSDDIELIKGIASITQVPLRLDANGGWTTEFAQYFIQETQGLPIEFVEQPLSADDDQEMPTLKKNVQRILIADESCHGVDDVGKCADGFDGINIKLMKCGGITPALQMIKLARTLNLKVMLGCMTETSIGISAAAQLAPLVDFVDLDGALLIKNDIAQGVKIATGGEIIFPETPGNGITINK